MTGLSVTRDGLSTVVQAGAWVVIVLLALIMQVMPLLLILTLFNIAVGVSSTTVLVIIPVALFGMLLVACSVAEQRRKRALPPPLPARNLAPHPDEALRSTAPCMLPYLRRRRFF